MQAGLGVLMSDAANLPADRNGVMQQRVGRIARLGTLADLFPTAGAQLTGFLLHRLGHKRWAGDPFIDGDPEGVNITLGGHDYRRAGTSSKDQERENCMFHSSIYGNPPFTRQA